MCADHLDELLLGNVIVLAERKRGAVPDAGISTVLGMAVDSSGVDYQVCIIAVCRWLGSGQFESMPRDCALIQHINAYTMLTARVLCTHTRNIFASHNDPAT